MSNKGNYYKQKTKKWFIDEGWACDFCERYRRFMVDGKVTHIKQDLFGADGIAMDGERIVFWNSKFGKSSISGGIKEMARFPYPPCVTRWIVHWEKGAKQPTIVDVGEATE